MYIINTHRKKKVECYISLYGAFHACAELMFCDFIDCELYDNVYGAQFENLSCLVYLNILDNSTGHPLTLFESRLHLLKNRV